MKLAKPVHKLETQRLVYAKYLLLQSGAFLENRLVESYFNLTIVLCANAVEILCQTLSYCLDGKDRSDDAISEVLKSLRKIDEFPFSEFTKVIRARNGLYHNATMHTYSTCADIREITERAFRQLYANPLSTDFDSISLTDLIKDESIRLPLRKAEEFLLKNNLTDSAISSCEAFARLEDRIMMRGHRQLPQHPGQSFPTTISWQTVQRLVGSGSNVTRIGEHDINTDLRLFSRHIDEQVDKKISGVVQYFNLLLMLGSHFEDYKHFRSLAPVYHIVADKSFRCERVTAEAMSYTREQAEFILGFVRTVMLDVEPKLRTIELRNLAKKVVQTIE